MMRVLRSVRALVVAGLVGSVALTLGVITWRNYRFTTALLTAQAEQSMAANVSATASRLDALLSARLDAVRTLALSPVLVAAARGDARAYPDAQRALRSMLRQDAIQNVVVAVVDNDRRLRVATGPVGDQGSGRRSSELLFPIVMAFADSSGAVPQMAFLAAIRDADGTQVGVLGLRVRTTLLTPVLTELAASVGRESVVRLRQQSGLVMAAWPFPRTGAVRPIPMPWVATPNGMTVTDSSSWPGGVRGRRLLHRASGNALRETAVRLSTVPWYVALTLDEGTLLAPAVHEARMALVSSLALLAILGGLAAWAGSRFATRIEGLAGVVRTLASGDRRARVPHSGHRDELGQLGEDVNVMADRIDSLVTNLEARRQQLEHELDERRRLESKLVASRRMEALGQLAGTVAHDFNNVLTIVSTAAQGASLALPESSGVRDDLREVIQAANRGADITRQLLSLARQGAYQPEHFDAATVLREHERMLRRLVKAPIALDVQTGDLPLPVHADRTQLVQSLLNLVTNARDAIGDRPGHVVVQASTCDVAPRGLLGGGTLTGSTFVIIAVRDDGSGIDDDTIQHLCEPFFTTKRRGAGTGLGLASVAAAMARASGALALTSRVGEGSTFTLAFPLEGTS